MPLALKVVPELDEHALDSVGRDATSIFDTIGHGAGGSFIEGLTRGMGGAGGASRAFSGVTAAAGEMGTGIAAAAAIGVTAVAGVVVGAEKLGEALYGVGARFDAVFDSLAVRTGKVGADFDALTASIQRTATTTASSLEKIGQVGGELSVALGVSGQALDNLTKQVSDLDRMTGSTTNIRQLGETLRAFGDVGDAAEHLDTFNAASQQTLIPVNELVSTLGNLAPVAQTLGLNIENTTAFIVAMTSAGVDANTSTMALNKAAATFADKNIDLKTGLADTITQIRGYIDAGKDAAAIDLAGKVFGERGAERFVQAIRDGSLNVQTLTSSLAGTGNTIANLNDRTADWAENWTILKNRVSDIAETVGGPLFDALNKVLSVTVALAVPVVLPQGPSGPAPLGYTPPSLPGLLAAQQPGVGAVQGPTPGGWADIYGPGAPPWMTPIAPVVPPGGWPTGPGSPQDIAAAVAAKPGGAAGTPQVPYPPGYGEPPGPGESPEQWKKRQDAMEAQHRVDVAQAELAAATTPEETLKAQNDLAKAKEQQIRGGLPGGAGGAGAGPQVPYGPGYGAPPRPGETAQQYSAEQNLFEAQHKSAEAQAKLNEVMASGAASTDELTKAQNDLQKAHTDENSAILRLNESTNKATDQLDQLGAGLDKDLGLSKGLPGLADNLVRFIGSLAAAPLLGPLKAISDAQGGIDATGSGAFGIAASLGAFGEQYTPAGQAAAKAASGGGGGGAGYQPSGSAGGGGSQPSGGSGGGGGAATPSAPAGSNEQIVHQAMLTAGWDESQWPALRQLMMHESGFRNTAANPSGAYGMFQFMPYTWGTYGSGSKTDDPTLQAKYGMQYIQGRYGSPQAAWAQYFNHPGGEGSYATGGAVPIIAHGGEHVFTADDVNAMGGQAGVYAFRNALHMEGGGTVAPPPFLDQYKQSITGTNAPKPQPSSLDAPPPVTRGNIPPLPPIAGQPPHAGTGAAPGPSPIGGSEKPTPPGGGVSGGGAVGAATSAAAMAADLFAPGSGAAVQIASQEIMRAIKFGSQAAGIGVGGLMETFLPTGASDLANNNWITRIAGGVAGVQPQIPNVAGKSASVDAMQQQALTPANLPPPISSGQGTGRAPGPPVINNITVDNSKVHDIQSDVTHHQTQVGATPGAR